MFFAIFIAYPILVIVPAFGFLVFDRLRPRRFIRTTAFIWLFYGLYEYLMKRRILCSGECNIRVDLLLIYPVLLVISIASIIIYVRAGRTAS